MQESAPSQTKPRKRIPRKAVPSVSDIPLPEAPRSRFEAFATAPVDRSLIKNAPYNPRIIDEDAKFRLEQELKRGVVQPPVWNKRTGNLVGGHQRLGRLDELHQGKPYSLTVAVIDCDETEEKRLNIALNNADLMGQYDPTRLEEVLRDIRAVDGTVDLLEATGFSQASLETMLISPDLYLPPEDSDTVRTILEDADAVQELKGHKNRHKKDSQLAAKREVMRQIVFVLPDTKEMPEVRAKIFQKLGVPLDHDSAFIDAFRLTNALGVEMKSEDEEASE